MLLFHITLENEFCTPTVNTFCIIITLATALGMVYSIIYNRMSYRFVNEPVYNGYTIAPVAVTGAVHQNKGRLTPRAKLRYTRGVNKPHGVQSSPYI